MITEQLLKDTLIICLCGLFVAGRTEQCIRNLCEDTIFYSAFPYIKLQGMKQFFSSMGVTSSHMHRIPP